MRAAGRSIRFDVMSHARLLKTMGEGDAAPVWVRAEPAPSGKPASIKY